MTFKERIAYLLEDTKTFAGKSIDLFLIAINLLACVHYVVEVESQTARMHRFLHVCELVLVTIFIIEWLLRVYSAKQRLRFVFSVYSFIDIISILPVLFSVYNLGFLRILRVFRILRFQKYLRDERFFFGTLDSVQLQIMRIIFIILSIVFLSSGIMFEMDAIDGVKTFPTLLDAVYFTVSTISTVGFGDFTPQTALGKLLTIAIIFSGIILLPYNVGKLIKLIIVPKDSRVSFTCPRCGHITYDKGAFCSFCGYAEARTS